MSIGLADLNATSCGFPMAVLMTETDVTWRNMLVQKQLPWRNTWDCVRFQMCWTSSLTRRSFAGTDYMHSGVSGAWRTTLDGCRPLTVRTRGACDTTLGDWLCVGRVRALKSPRSAESSAVGLVHGEFGSAKKNARDLSSRIPIRARRSSRGHRSIPDTSMNTVKRVTH